MDDTIFLRVFAAFTLVFGLVGLLAAKPLYLALAALAVALLIGEVLMGGEDAKRRRSARRRTDISPYDPRC